MKKLILLSVLIFLAGCATTPIYHGPNGPEPFARINFQPIEGLEKVIGGLAVKPKTINGSSVSFQNITDSIFVQPGTSDFVIKGISPDRLTTADCDFSLDVKGGELYLFKRTMVASDFIFIVQNAKGEVVLEKRVPGIKSGAVSQ